MVEEIVSGIFKVFFRIIGQIFMELIFELLLKGSGYFIYKLFSKQEPDPDGFIVVITGIVFWILIVGVGFVLYQYIGTNGSV
jgi:hypothetical protein